MSVESLQKALEISLAKERSLRKLWNEALDELVVFVPSTEKLEICDPDTKETWIVTTAKPEQWSMFLDCLDSWIVKMRRVFDETFPKEEKQAKVSVDRKQLSEKKDEYQKRLDSVQESHESNIALASAISVLKELLAGSGEPLNLALAFADVKKKKSSGSDNPK